MSARFESLMARLLDDALDPSGRAELADLIAADPALQRRYVAAIQQEVALHEQLRGGLTESARIEASELRRAVGAPGTGPVRRRPKRRAAAPRRARRRSTVPLLPLAVVAVLLVVLGGAWLLRPQPPAPAAWIAAGDLAGLPAGVALVPGTGGVAGSEGAEVQCADGSRLRLAPGSALVVVELGSAWRFRLDGGRVAVEVSPQRPGGRFAIVTSELTAEVVGTRFAVRHAGDGSEVAVAAGAVRVQSRDGRSILLGPGERFHSRPPPEPVVEPPPAPAAEPEPAPEPAAEPAPVAPEPVPAITVDGLSDPGWSIAGDLVLDGEGGDRVAASPAESGVWRGRSFTWPRSIPADQGFSLEAVVTVPDDLIGDWHVELAAVAESPLDSQGQARRMLRFQLDENGHAIQQLIDGPDIKQDILRDGPAVAPGPHRLRLQVVGHQLVAELDGRTIYADRLIHGYAELRPSLRVARKLDTRGTLVVDAVVLRSPPAVR